MTKLLKISAVAMVTLVLATGTALAQNGNPCPGSKAYQVNIIGSGIKNPPMTGNNGHRIFVNLNGNSKIIMTGDTDQNNANGLQCGTKFQVLDANATGGAG